MLVFLKIWCGPDRRRLEPHHSSHFEMKISMIVRFRPGSWSGAETQMPETRDQGGDFWPQATEGTALEGGQTKNKRSDRKMSDAIFIAEKAQGPLVIGDKNEIDRAVWRKPRGIGLTPTSRCIRDMLFPRP
jgi:hypothetical protein